MAVTTQVEDRTETLSADDLDRWRESYQEALLRGAGSNVARFFADQRVAYLRRDRDGVAITGDGDYQTYR